MGSLFTDSSLEIRNSKWRIQYGEQKVKNLLEWDDIWYSGVFEVADEESELKNQKFKMADENADIYLIGTIFDTRWFLASLII